MKLGIAIRGYHSPNLLNLTLESIFKADKISNIIIGIYLEKSISDEIRQELFTIISNYPIDKVLISGFYSNNTFDNTYPLGDMFNKENCDMVQPAPRVVKVLLPLLSVINGTARENENGAQAVNG